MTETAKHENNGAETGAEVETSAVSGTVMGADAGPQPYAHIPDTTELQAHWSAVNPDTFAEVVADPSEDDKFYASLANVYSGAEAVGVAVSHAQSVAMAYAIAMADVRKGGKITAEEGRLTLAKLDPKHAKLSDGRVTQLRNAGYLLTTLRIPLTDPRLGKWMTSNVISEPILAARQVLELESGSTEDATKAFEAKMTEKTEAARAKRADARKGTTAQTDAPAESADTREARIATEKAAHDSDLANIAKGKGEARKQDLLTVVNALPLATAEDVAIALDLVDAILTRVADRATADAEVVAEGRRIAAERQAEGREARAKLDQGTTARKRAQSRRQSS